MTISDAELADWRRITMRATPGEWRQGAFEKYHVFCDEHLGKLLSEPGRVLLRMNTYFSYEADALFIATARTAMPRLIRAVAACNQVAYAMCTGQEQDLIDRLDTLAEITDRLERTEAELQVYKTKGAGPFEKRAADLLADEVNVLVRRKVIDSRSPAADALLDYRAPPFNERSDRMAKLERDLESTRKALADLVEITDVLDAGWSGVPNNIGETCRRYKSHRVLCVSLSKEPNTP